MRFPASLPLSLKLGYTQVMQIERISDTFHHIMFSDGDEVFLIGTAHVSQNSVAEVAEVIEKENPDRICVELDASRLASKTKKQSWEETDIRKVFKEGKGFLLLANTALASFQRKLGAQTGTKPGEELLGAVKLAEDKNIPLSLCDRDIQTTFRRAWAKSSLWNKCKLLGTLISAAFSDEEISPEELEELKKQETLEGMLNEVAKELPSIKEVLIDERDTYLATKIYSAPGKKKVAVIGAGHTKGVLSTFESLENNGHVKSAEELETVPKSKGLGKAAGYIIPALIVILLIIGIAMNGWDQGLKTFLYWILVNASGTFITTLIAGAHPLNIICCAITAPFFALNPVLGVGMLGGILEATFRKPKVKDFENLNDDAMKLSGWYKNRILHCLLVFFLSSLGSMLGTFVAFPLLIARI